MWRGCARGELQMQCQVLTLENSARQMNRQLEIFPIEIGRFVIICIEWHHFAQVTFSISHFPIEIKYTNQMSHIREINVHTCKPSHS